MISDADEEEHAEHLGRDPRAVVRHRRPVMLVLVVAGRCSACADMAMPVTSARHCRPRRARPAGFVSLRSRSTRSRRSQPERAPRNVETMISSTRSSSHRLHRRGERVGMRDLAVHVDPLAAQLSDARAAAAARPRRARRRESPCGEMMRKLAGPAAARSRIFSSSGSPSTVWFAIDEDVRLARAPRPGRRRRARTGAIAGDAAHLVDDVRAGASRTSSAGASRR